MEGFYRFNPVISCSGEIVRVDNISAATTAGFHGSADNMLQFKAAEPEVSGSEMTDLIKTQIANHPLYPNLVSAYIECQKVSLPLRDNLMLLFKCFCLE